MALDQGVFTKLPGFEETAARIAFSQSIDLHTLAIFCPDPRANGIPAAVAHEFGDVWPGEAIRDESGAKVGATTNLGLMITVGGRAVDALRTITTLNHMLGLQNVVVVHHTFCGTTAFTPDGLLQGFQHDHGKDLSHVYDRESLAIADFGQSLAYDVKLIRDAPGTPAHVNVYGFLYDIDAETLTKVVEDLGTGRAVKPYQTLQVTA